MKVHQSHGLHVRDFLFSCRKVFGEGANIGESEIREELFSKRSSKTRKFFKKYKKIFIMTLIIRQKFDIITVCRIVVNTIDGNTIDGKTKDQETKYDVFEKSIGKRSFGL